MVDLSKTLFRYARDGEEPLNDFFVSLLARTDTDKVLNAIHDDDDISFDNSARIIETQRSGLDRFAEENERRRTLDWVVRDNSKLVGYESKKGDNELDEKQLIEEWRKLRINSRGNEEVHLVAVTETTTQPDLEVDFIWKSWFDIGDAIINIRGKDKILDILSDYMREMGYESFTGFSDYEHTESWFVQRQNEVASFVTELEERAQGFKMYETPSGTKKGTINLHNRIREKPKQVREKSHRVFSTSHYVVPFHPNGYRSSNPDYNISEDGWYIAVVAPALNNELYIQLDTYPSKSSEIRGTFEEEADGIADLMESEGMHLATSRNSLQHHLPPNRYTTADEIEDVLENKAGRDQWKRLRFGWELDTSLSEEELQEDAIDRMEKLQDLFYEEDAIRRKGF